MKYSFELKQTLTLCNNCPCLKDRYDNVCGISNNVLESDFGKIDRPADCPLVEIEGEQK